MKVAGKGQGLARTQNDFSKEIAIVHRIEKRKARINARRRQNREKRSVRAVTGIAVSTGIIVSGAQPWANARPKPRLPPAFDCRRARFLRQHAPTAILQSAPSEQIERPGGRSSRHDEVAAVRSDVDATAILSAHAARKVLR